MSCFKMGLLDLFFIFGLILFTISDTYIGQKKSYHFC